MRLSPDQLARCRPNCDLLTEGLCAALCLRKSWPQTLSFKRGTTCPDLLACKHLGGPEMRVLSYLLIVFIGQLLMIFDAQAEVRAPTPSLIWQIFKVPEYGTRVEYPARIFAPVGEAERGVGQRFESTGGRAVLSIYSRENETADTPASYLRKNLRQSGLDYERVTRSFFAISMERDGRILYSRCNFSRSPIAIHCFDLEYPQEEKRAWDPVVTRISLSLRPLER